MSKLTYSYPLRPTLTYSQKDKILNKRASWLIRLVNPLANDLLVKMWNEEKLSSLQEYPHLKPYKSIEKTLGIPQVKNLYLPSRVKRLSEELAGRIIRSQLEEKEIIEKLINNGSTDEYPDVWVRNLKRGFTRKKNVAEANKKSINTFFDYKPEAPVLDKLKKTVLYLSSTDKQFVFWDIDSSGSECTKYILNLKLPLIPEPQKRKDWGWVKIPVHVPEYVENKITKNTKICLPNLRLSEEKLIIDFIIQNEKPNLSDTSRTGVGVDWGERRLLTLADGWLNKDDQVCLSGRPAFFNSKGYQAKQVERRRAASRLRAKRDKLDNLLTSGKCSNQKELRAKRELLEKERQQIWKAYSRSSINMSHYAARWVIEHAKSIGANLIILENLKSLEARFPNKRLNERVNHQLRSSITKLIVMKAKQEGLKVQYVNPRGTSSTCPVCAAQVKHHKAPDDFEEGRGWATCLKCGKSKDRDLLAAEHILKRGLEYYQCKKIIQKKNCKPRYQTRPSLTPYKKSSSGSVQRSSKVEQGMTVRSYSRSRPRFNLNNWNRSQRDYYHSKSNHRLKDGYQRAYTSRAKLTLPRPVHTLQELQE